MSRTPPKVTVAIPTINRSALLLRAMRSVLAQTYPNIELLVSDDASTDDTHARIASIDDPRLVHYRRETTLGLVGNFDFCLRHASGEFFLLLGDDDLLLPRAVEQLIQPFLTGTDVGMSWCPCYIADTASDRFWTTAAGPALENPAAMLANLWGGRRGPRLSGILLRTADALAQGGFRVSHGDLCDIGLWAAVALNHRFIACADQPFVQYTNHHNSTTSRSAVGQWRRFTDRVFIDLLAQADPPSQRILRSAKRNFHSGIALTVLIQTIGKPSWVRNAVGETLRSPGAILTPYVFRRLLQDGWKVVVLSRRSKGKPTMSLYQLATDMAHRLGGRNILIRALMDRKVRHHGARLHLRDGALEITKDTRVIRIAPRHFVHADGLSRDFDAQFAALVPAQQNGRSVIDYSRPTLQTYRASGLQFELASFPEEEDAIEGYFHWYRPVPGDTVYDVGAHCGVSVYHFSRLVGKRGRVIAFEPDPLNYTLLLRNIERHQLTNVVPVKLAIAGLRGTAAFNSEGSITSSLARTSDHTAGSVEIVETITLADAFERWGTPALCKIDTEGAEVETLAEAAAYLARYKVQFALDTSHIVSGRQTTTDVERNFAAAGYETESLPVGGIMTTWARPRTSLSRSAAS